MVNSWRYFVICRMTTRPYIEVYILRLSHELPAKDDSSKEDLSGGKDETRVSDHTVSWRFVVTGSNYLTGSRTDWML